MSLYHKYRPKNLKEIVGNEELVTTLSTNLSRQDHPHAYLLFGPTGCGKTTIARIIANELCCAGTDYREVDSADFRGIDTIREIRQQSQFKPLASECRVWLLDEAHKLSGDAQAALLKALEDPPRFVYYILATTDPQKLLDTIKGRCSPYQLSPLSDIQMLRLLRRVVRLEDQETSVEVLDQIVQDSQGRPRDALQILDQVIGVPHDQQLAVARRQAESQSQIIELCRALIDRTGWTKVRNILSSLREQGQEAENVRRAVLGYCASVLLKRENTIAAAAMEAMIVNTYDSGWPGLIFAAYSIVK